MDCYYHNFSRSTYEILDNAYIKLVWHKEVLMGIVESRADTWWERTHDATAVMIKGNQVIRAPSTIHKPLGVLLLAQSGGGLKAGLIQCLHFTNKDRLLSPPAGLGLGHKESVAEQGQNWLLRPLG